MNSLTDLTDPGNRIWDFLLKFKSVPTALRRSSGRQLFNDLGIIKYFNTTTSYGSFLGVKGGPGFGSVLFKF